MLRSSVGWCFAILLVVGGMNACSGKSGDEATGTAGSGGSGMIVGGSGGTSGAGTAGTRTGGTSGAACDGVPYCVDTKQIAACDPLTGVTQMQDCTVDADKKGLIIAGCDTQASSGAAFCNVTGFADDVCKASVDAAQFCDPTVTDNDAIKYYIACFQDLNGVKAAFTCLGDAVTPGTSTSGDCKKAFDTCFNSGAGGEGAGGAAPEPMGGAGGAGGAP